MKFFKLKLQITTGFLVCALLFTACGPNVGKEGDSSPNPTAASEEDFSDVGTEYYLENGYYTIGTDIPAGICDIAVTAGAGSILYSADGTVETYSQYDDDLNQSLATDSSFEPINSYTLKEGYIIHISGAVRVKVSYHKVTSRFTGRDYDEENKITLEPGSYTAGKDFEAGVYTITATEGTGTITSSNAFELGIDELFGVFDGTETYVPRAVNVTLNEGDTLELADVTAELMKVK